MKLLIVEDDPGLLLLLHKAATEAGYAVQTESDGGAALDRLLPSSSGGVGSEPFDLVILDVMLPTLSGFEICRRARAGRVATPILLLTARDALKDKVEGLDAGADDYLVKPFQVAELLARVRALLRRNTPFVSGVLTVGDLSLDPASRRARRGEKTLQFSATEYALLEYLMRNAGRVLTRSQILEHVWQYDFAATGDNVLDVYISYLRNKIDKGFAHPLIHTVRGVGFVMEDRQAEKP